MVRIYPHSVVLLFVTWSQAVYIPDDIVLPPSLIESLEVVANGLMQEGNETTTTPSPPPGIMDICTNLCPKWCEKVEGQQGTYTHCHYLCGNLCEEKVVQSNHFIGNPRYEVVPSEFEFDMYDKNGDKLISRHEFSTAEQISVEEIDQVFTSMDFDNDGFISNEEFKGSPLVFTVQMAEELSNMAKTKLKPAQ